MQDKKVAHLVYRFDVGGLETVLLNLINNLPDQQFQHVIISLTTANKDFAKKIIPNVAIYELNKPVGNSLIVYKQLWELFSKHKPDIVHTYNIATLEYQIIAWLLGVEMRIHAEHGRDIYDLEGKNKKYQILRRIMDRFIHRWAPVSAELSKWLVSVVKIPENKVKLIYNGIDINKYQSSMNRDDGLFHVVTVGRLAAVKDQITLIKSIQDLITKFPERRPKIKLTIIGDGELKPLLAAYINDYGLSDCIELYGSCGNVAEQLGYANLFVLPSLAEGIALTILEAMACGLPVIATQVGGNPELVEAGINGEFIMPKQVTELTNHILKYMDDAELCRTHGIAGSIKVRQYFSLDKMIKEYYNLYIGAV